jgi:formylglycine-generating enzyme required for sulfatase activity
MSSDEDPILLPPDLRDRLIATVRSRLPRKSFGYFISSGNPREPSDFLMLEGNIRNSPEWQGDFHTHGQYFIEHDDAGFVATPEESWHLQKQIWARNMTEIGIFHSHLRHPGNFSGIDYEMHMQRFESLWHMIISARNPERPQLRAFDVARTGVRELRLHSEPSPAGLDRPPRLDPAADALIGEARRLLVLDPAGRPRCKDNRAIFRVIEAVLGTRDRTLIEELLLSGFLRGSEERYHRHMAPRMRLLGPGSFHMGTPAERAAHFCGEVPSHAVDLSPFTMAETPVTNQQLGLLDERRCDVRPGDRRKPAIGLSWFDAAVFALWMGCRLPTEAEWEFACGAGSEGEWCCGDEGGLARHAWYSENSSGEAHLVATREPNAFGLFDLHGNVWEWCRDDYDQDYYGRAPRRDPANIALIEGNKVCRGGSMHALSEMCRSRFRLHEPPEFTAGDLGLRVAGNAGEGERHGELRAPFTPV